MNRFAMIIAVLVGAFLWTATATAGPHGITVFSQGKSQLHVQVSQLTKKKRALEVVKELERFITRLAEQPSKKMAGMTLAAKSKGSIQNKLKKEHDKARNGTYHRDFHDAIRNNAGKRLREEFRKHCRNMPKREVNCP